MNSLYPVSALDAVRDEYGQSVSAVDNSINEQMLFVQRVRMNRNVLKDASLV